MQSANVLKNIVLNVHQKVWNKKIKVKEGGFITTIPS